jgi:hypothetical protein
VLEDTEAQAWLQHKAPVIAANVANALGIEKLGALSAAKEAAGELVFAARVAWVACSVLHTASQVITDLTYRAADLLETADDPGCTAFEKEVLSAAWTLDMGTDRHTKAQCRREHLQASDKPTFETAMGKWNAAWTGAFVEWGYFRRPWPLLEGDMRGGVEQIVQSTEHAVVASQLTDDPSLQHMAAFVHKHMLFQTMCYSHVPEIWNPHLCGGEAAFIAALDFYTWGRCGKLHKASPTGMNHALCTLMPLALWLGDLSRVDKWVVAATDRYTKDLDIPSTKTFAGHTPETCHMLLSMPLLLKLNRSAQAHGVLAAIGMDWSANGKLVMDAYVEGLASVLPGAVIALERDFIRLLVYLVCPQSAALDAQANAWIATPAALALQESENSSSMSASGLFLPGGMLTMAARVFLKLGRDADAEESARIALLPERHLFGKYHLVECRTVLGQVAANRGNAEEAGGHFARALEEARASRLPMLELVVARDWKRAVGEYAEADAVIDGACAAMGKSREEMVSVL